ncbi:MAG: class I SAM-dependent methyltransferase [Bacteroidetes bacterium]|nr:class I SAM-dependent methyltransferase [Bacteroidota bacterium]
MMKLADHTAHYKRDADEFDYFAERSGADLDAAIRIQQAVMHEIPPHRGSRILDIGSGGGWLHASLAQRIPEATVVSADLGLTNLRKLRRQHPDALLVAADAEQLPFRTGSFDTVIASEILEHLNHPGQAVREAAAVLAPRGRYIVSTPYREHLRYYLCIHCNQPTPANAHLHSFDEHSLSEIFLTAKLTGIRHFLFQNKALVFLRISWLLRFLPFRLWKIIDRLSNLLVRKPHTIIISAEKLPST